MIFVFIMLFLDNKIVVIARSIIIINSNSIDYYIFNISNCSNSINKLMVLQKNGS